MTEDKIVRLVLKDAAMFTRRVVGVAILALHLDHASQYWVNGGLEDGRWMDDGRRTVGDESAVNKEVGIAIYLS